MCSTYDHGVARVLVKFLELLMAIVVCWTDVGLAGRQSLFNFYIEESVSYSEATSHLREVLCRS